MTRPLEASDSLDTASHQWPALPPHCLATPGRRLAAAGTDSALWVTLHLLYWLFAASAATPATISSASDARINAASVALVWLYFWLGWACGATPGQWLWKVRVVTLDGARPGLLRSFVRCIGYALACLPLKAGLAVAWFHPRRQGWHDLLARTVVVNTGAPRHFVLSPISPQTESRPAPHLLTMNAARRHWPLVAIAYLALAVFVTWPVSAHLSTHAAGGGFNKDDGVFAWNLWFFRHALLHGQSPLSTSLLFYPRRVSLLFHTMNWFNCALGMGLQQFFGLVLTYNLIFLFTFAACAFSAYWFCCAWTRDRIASFVAALPFGFSPYFLSHAQGHENLHAAQFIPVFALFYWAALTTGRKRWAVAAGIALALNGLCDWQYLLFSGGLGLSMWGGIEACYFGHATARVTRIRQTALSFSVGAVLLSPLLLPALSIQHGNASVNKSGQMGGFKADVADFFAPNPFHPLARAGGNVARTDVEEWIAPGWTVLLLATAGFWSARRKLRPWLWITGLFALAASGPFLTIRGDPPVPAAVTYVLGGLPGVAFDPPWDNLQLVDTTCNMAGSPADIMRPRVQWALPLKWAPQFIPPLRPFRAPVRLMVVVLLGLSLGLACALSRLRKLMVLRARPGLLVPGIAGLLILAEYCAYPYPERPVQWNPFYRTIAADSSARAIIEVPLVANPAAMARQAFHGKAIFVGNLARADDSAFDFVASNALLRRLSPIHFPARKAPARVPSVNDLAAAVAELRAIGTRYIIVYKAQAEAFHVGRLAKYYVLLEGRLRLPRVYDDPEIRVYRL